MSTPPSPTLSAASTTWMTRKSPTELIPMLKNAYHALKDKEQDLMLAAQIGKSLLDNNIALKTYYEDLLNQAQAAPLPTPSSSSCVVLDEKHAVATLMQEEDDNSDMHYVPSRITREAMIEVLERKNTELGAQLEVALEHHGLLDRSSTKEAQQLQKEITHLRENLEMATAKIRELEEMNQNARQKRPDPAPPSETSNEELHQQEMGELLADIERLQIEKDAVAHSKVEVESKLADTLQDLRCLKEQFEQLQFTQTSYDDLQAAYERQFRHVAELKECVQEHQSVLQKLRDRGINIHATPSPSVYDGSELGIPTQRCETLFGELESAWAKRSQTQHRQSMSSTDDLSTSTRSMFEHASTFCKEGISATTPVDDDSFSLESIFARVSGVDQQQLDEALSFVNRLEEELKTYRDHEDFDEVSSSPVSLAAYPQTPLYPEVSRSSTLDTNTDQDTPPKSILGRLRSLQRQCLQAVWRWCRFTIVLTVAVLINLWQGPESMLLETQTHHRLSN